MVKKRHSLFNPILYWSLLGLSVGTIGAIIYQGVSDQLATIEHERSIIVMKELSNKPRQLQLACEILNKYPRETRALKVAVQLSRIPGWDKRLKILSPIFDPEPETKRLLSTRMGAWRLLEARYRYACEHWQRAAHLFEERSTGGLIHEDSMRLIRALLKCKRPAKAWRFTLRMTKQNPDLHLLILKAMIAEKSELVRPLACDIALSCLQQPRSEFKILALTAELQTDHAELASALLGTTLSQISTKKLQTRRALLNKEIASHWVKKLIEFKKIHGQIVPQNVPKNLINPWGQPYVLDRRSEHLITRMGSHKKSPLMKVAIKEEKRKTAPQTLKNP
jgi:hypothetical protein